jgi:hypothetical protein
MSAFHQIDPGSNLGRCKRFLQTLLTLTLGVGEVIHCVHSLSTLGILWIAYMQTYPTQICFDSLTIHADWVLRAPKNMGIWELNGHVITSFIRKTLILPPVMYAKTS